MFAWTIASVVAALCIAASAREARRVERSAPLPPEALVKQLRGAVSPTDAARLARELSEDHPLRGLMESAAHGPSREQSVAELNEQLREVSDALSGAAMTGRAAARIALFASVCLALLHLAHSMSNGRPDVTTAIGVVGIGIVGAGASAFLSRQAGERAERRRQTYDDVVRSLERLLNRRFGSDPAVIPIDGRLDPGSGAP